ncbi:MAG TPA: hypothetical protein P5105_06715 [Victivallales bacterium]|nr:hypothetical protein [Victivallales bacterium]HPO90393.1 hypothetical protein [Victivallales bacterium]HRR06959.1 hypothetical protein [Victivallales bacterium]HRU01547.1 hypothetical protein [Victivallales bacterium]
MDSLLPVNRTFKILKICSKSSCGVSFTELKKELNPIAPGILSRLLKTLVIENALIKNEAGLYTCGKLLKELSLNLKEPINIRECTTNLLKALAQDSGFSAAYFELREGGLFLLAKSEVSDGFHYIDIERAMGNLLKHSFSHIAIAYGESYTLKMLNIPKDLLSNKKLQARLCEIRKGKMAFYDFFTENKIFRIGYPVICNKKLRGVVGITTHLKIKEQKKLTMICNLIKNTAKKIGELYESNNANV